MITASHNPPIFNGFKIKAHYGGSAESPLCQAVEKLLDQNPVRARAAADAIRAGRMKVRDLRPALFRAIKRIVDFQIDRALEAPLRPRGALWRGGGLF